MRKVVQAALAVCVTVGLMPAPAFAGEQIAAGSSPELAAQAAPETLLAETDNAWGHDYTKWSQPQTSFMHVNAAGDLERVEYEDGAGLVVEQIAPGYQAVSSKATVQPSTYIPTGATQGSTLWGGFFSGATANFVVTGQPNRSESPSVAVYRVTKYDKDWNYLAHVELNGANTFMPFDAGTCSMAELGGALYVRTSHLMYAGGDRLNHQANAAMTIDEATMTVTSSGPEMANIGTEAGYVSHSFNQAVAVSGGAVYGVDHGDGYPRSVGVKKYGGGNVDVLPIPGGVGMNATGASLGGVAPTGDGLLVAGNATDLDAFVAAGYSEVGMPRNVWVASVSSDLNVSKKDLTGYTAAEGKSASTPFVVKAADDRFLVMWEVLSQDSASKRSHTSEIAYRFVDGSGSPVGATRSATGVLSDCQPVVHGGKAVWYASAGGVPVVYAIDLQTGAFQDYGTLAGADVAFANVKAKAFDYNLMADVENAMYYSDLRELGPGTTVKLGARTLVEGEDYEESLAIDKDSLTATVTLTGKGAYAGQGTRLAFNIAAQTIEGIGVFNDRETSGTHVYDGERVQPRFEVADKYGRLLEEGVDYIVGPVPDIVNAGNYSVPITGIGFYARSRNGVVQVGYASDEDIDFTLSPSHFTYDGKHKEPAVSASFRGRTLVEGIDYEITYNTMTWNAGTANVFVSGLGNFRYIRYVPFTIDPKPIDNAVVTVWAVGYVRGEELRPFADVMVDGVELAYGLDYQITASEGPAAGSGTMRIEGLGNYGSAIEVPYDTSESVRTIDLSGGGQPTTGGGTGSGTATKPGDGGTGNESGAGGAGSPDVPAAKSDLSKAVLSGLKAKTYTGKALHSAPVVTLNGKRLAEGVDYELSYSDATNVGKATVTATGIGAYTGSASASYAINPKGTSLSKLTAKKRGFTAKWKKRAAQVSGYQLQYAKDAAFKKGAKTVTAAKAKTASRAVGKLKAKAKYHVRVRTYKAVGGKKYFSSWSKAKTVTTR